MTDDRPFTPWHGGRNPPVSLTTEVVMKLRCGWITQIWQAGKFIWLHRGDHPGDIVGWRLA